MIFSNLGRTISISLNSAITCGPLWVRNVYFMASPPEEVKSQLRPLRPPAAVVLRRGLINLDWCASEDGGQQLAAYHCQTRRLVRAAGAVSSQPPARLLPLQARLATHSYARVRSNSAIPRSYDTWRPREMIFVFGESGRRMLRRYP